MIAKKHYKFFQLKSKVRIHIHALKSLQIFSLLSDQKHKRPNTQTPAHMHKHNKVTKTTSQEHKRAGIKTLSGATRVLYCTWINENFLSA